MKPYDFSLVLHVFPQKLDSARSSFGEQLVNNIESHIFKSIVKTWGSWIDVSWIIHADENWIKINVKKRELQSEPCLIL